MYLQLLQLRRSRRCLCWDMLSKRTIMYAVWPKYLSYRSVSTHTHQAVWIKTTTRLAVQISKPDNLSSKLPQRQAVQLTISLSAICTGVAPGTLAPPTPTISFVPNPYFSFPYIPTSLAGPNACSQAVSQCDANYEVCTAQLAGANTGFQVTIAVPGLPGADGTTIVGGAGVTYPTASATSICRFPWEVVTLIKTAADNVFQVVACQEPRAGI